MIRTETDAPDWAPDNNGRQRKTQNIIESENRKNGRKREQITANNGNQQRNNNGSCHRSVVERAALDLFQRSAGVEGLDELLAGRDVQTEKCLEVLVRCKVLLVDKMRRHDAGSVLDLGTGTVLTARRHTQEV